MRPQRTETRPVVIGHTCGVRAWPTACPASRVGWYEARSTVSSSRRLVAARRRHQRGVALRARGCSHGVNFFFFFLKHLPPHH